MLWWNYENKPQPKIGFLPYDGAERNLTDGGTIMKKEIHEIPTARNHEILIRREAAHLVRYSEKGFRNAIKLGVFPEIKIGKKRLYRKSALIRALEKREEFAQ